MPRLDRIAVPGLLLLAAAVAAAAAPPDAQRAQALERLLVQDCGSCHGLTGRGGLGPPLLAERLRGMPREVLVRTILDGRPGTAMPAWRALLRPHEAEWLVERILTRGNPR